MSWNNIKCHKWKENVYEKVSCCLKLASICMHTICVQINVYCNIFVFECIIEIGFYLQLATLRWHICLSKGNNSSVIGQESVNETLKIKQNDIE